MKLPRYKNTLVGRGSALEVALSLKEKTEADKAAKKIYNETTANYEKLYPETDRKWFQEKSFPQVIKPQVESENGSETTGIKETSSSTEIGSSNSSISGGSTQGP